MPSQKQFLALAFATVASATLAPRDAQECADSATKVLNELDDLPTPAETLVSFLAQQTQWATVTDACKIPAVTGSIAPDYSSYMSELSSWYGDHTKDVADFIDACTDVPEVSSQLAELPAQLTACSSLEWEKVASATATTTGSASSSDATATGEATSTAARPSSTSGNSDDSDSDSNSNDDGPDNAGTRQTGAVAAAAAIAALAAFAL